MAIFLFYLLLVFGLIVVHECGHYLAGRVAGIPARDMRIRLFRFPQHVVLRSGEQWISPVKDIKTYVELVWQHLKTTPRVYLYVAGGFLLETLFVITLGISLILFGEPKFAFVIVGLSLLMGLPWLILDSIMIWRGRIFGDLSGLWFLARVPTAFFITFLVASRVSMLWYLS